MVSPSPTFSVTISDRLWSVAKASRFLSWAFGPILYAIGVFHSRVIPRSRISLLRAGLQVFALSIPLSIIVFGVNDVYDYESDKRNPRKIIGGIEGRILHPIFHSDVLKAAYCCTVFIIASALITGGRENVIAIILLVVLGWQYSSPPLRLKEIPVLDSLSNGAIVFLTWFCGFSFSGLSIFEIPSMAIILSLCSTGIHALAAVMDTEADMASGQTTIATTFGKRPVAIFAALCYLVAVSTVEIQSVFGAYCWASLIVLIIPCVDVTLAHRTFQTILYLSISSALFWICLRASSMIKGRKIN